MIGERDAIGTERKMVEEMGRRDERKEGNSRGEDD